jgi:hypothetical protein
MANSPCRRRVGRLRLRRDRGRPTLAVADGTVGSDDVHANPAPFTSLPSAARMVALCVKGAGAAARPAARAPARARGNMDPTRI